MNVTFISPQNIYVFMEDVYTNTKKAIDEMTKSQRSSLENVKNSSKDILEPSRYVTTVRRQDE